VIAETEGDLIKRLNQWKDNVKFRGLRVNMNKSKVMVSGESEANAESCKMVMWCLFLLFQ